MRIADPDRGRKLGREAENQALPMFSAVPVLPAAGQPKLAAVPVPFVITPLRTWIAAYTSPSLNLRFLGGAPIRRST